MLKLLLNLCFIPVCVYGYFCIIELGIAARTQNVQMMVDGFGGLLWAGFWFIVLLLLQRLTSQTVTVKKR